MQPFTIDKITLREIHLDLINPFKTASSTQKARRILLIQLHDTDGATAWGECVALETPAYLPETIDTAWPTITQHIAPRILHHTFNSPQDIHPTLQKDLRGHNMAKAAIEMTCYTLAAQKQGISLSNLLSGTQSQVPTGISLGIQDSPDQLVQKVKQSIQEGYPRIKIKIQPGADIDYIQALRHAIGPDIPLTADANSAYTLQDLDHLKKLDPFNLTMIEQPLAWDDLTHHAQLQKALKTPICLDESIASLKDAQDMITLGAGRIINLKPGRVGGFHQSILIHDYCQANNIPLWCGGMLETGIGRACNIALASLPGFTLPGDLSPSRRYWKQDIVTPEWTMNNKGLVQVPTELPGLGVDIDEDRIEALTTQKEVLT